MSLNTLREFFILKRNKDQYKCSCWNVLQDVPSSKPVIPSVPSKHLGTLNPISLFLSYSNSPTQERVLPSLLQTWQHSFPQAEAPLKVRVALSGSKTLCSPPSAPSLMELPPVLPPEHCYRPKQHLHQTHWHG